MEALKISSSSYHRIIKDIKEKSNNVSKIDNNVLNTNSDSDSESKVTEKESEKESKKESEKESKKESESDNDNDNDNDKSDTETIKSVTNKTFDKDKFKKELNGTESEKEVDIIKPDIIKPETLGKKPKFFSQACTGEEYSSPRETIKNINNNIDTSMRYNKRIFKKNDDMSMLSNVSFNKKKLSNINDRTNIMDTIKNCNTGNIDDLKQKRSLIIIIRQYINTFEKQLINIYLNKNTFEKKLFTLSTEQLQIIIENIRIELNLGRNKDMFTTIVSNGLRGAEMVGKYSGYDVTGLENDLMHDPEFIMDLQIISCEIDLSKFVSPQKSAILKVIKKAYEKNTENKVKNTMTNVLNDKNKLDKILNLNKK